MISSIGVRTSSLTTNAAIVQWRNSSTGRVKTMEVSVIGVTATVQSFGIGVPAVMAGGPNDVTFLRDDPSDPVSLMFAAVTWTVAPTAPVKYVRRANNPGVIGVGIIWVFPRGYTMGLSSAHTIHGITTMVANDVNLIVDE